MLACCHGVSNYVCPWVLVVATGLPPDRTRPIASHDSCDHRAAVLPAY